LWFCRTWEARADIVEYITMSYNSHRLPSYLGYQSPEAFERNGQLAAAAELSGCDFHAAQDTK